MNISYSQSTGMIRGFVTDSTNGEAIPYANVVIKGTTIGSPTNPEGYFIIPGVPVGEHTLIASYLGYQSKEFSISVQEDEITEIDIQLVSSSVRLDDVSVFGNRSDRKQTTDLGMDRVTISDINMVPTGVETDVFRVLQSVAGVSTTGDVTAKYYVRGGGSDQNLVLLNGVTVYYPFHALGIVSVIDPEMISVMEFFKGGISPQYGGRLASILDISTRDGNKKEWQAMGQASFLTGKASVEGPIPGGSILITGRKSIYSDILKKYVDTKQAPFEFYDASFKMNYSNQDVMKNAKFMFHGFLSNDRVSNDDPLKEDYDINNKLVGFTWQQVWSNPLFSMLHLSYSGFEAEVIPNLSNAKPRYNELHDITLDWNFYYIFDNRDQLEFGLLGKYLDTKLELENMYGAKSSYKKSSRQLSAYGYYKFYHFEDVALDLGIRTKVLELSKKRSFIFEPRISFTYKPTPVYAIKASIGRYSQELTTLTDENELISIFQPYIIIPDYLAAAEATQVSLGVSYYFNEFIDMDTEAYYKDIINIYDINKQKYRSDDPDFINVDGEAYGLENIIRARLGRVYLKSTYALSWAYKIDDEVKYAPRYDTRHSYNILCNVNLGDDWSANLTWTFNTGMPFTPMTGYYENMELDRGGNDDFGSFIPEVFWGKKNTGRLPVYHRMDIGVKKKMELGFANITFGANIMNVYDKKNIFYFDPDTGQKVYMLPFFPSVSIKAEL